MVWARRFAIGTPRVRRPQNASSSIPRLRRAVDYATRAGDRAADGGDRRGPISVGAAATKALTAPEPAKPGNAAPAESKPPETRVVVMGASDFASNVAINISGNRDFFMNALNWLSQQENLIAVRPRQPEDRRLTLTADQQNRILILTIFVIPGLVFATGVYTWWKRR